MSRAGDMEPHHSRFTRLHLEMIANVVKDSGAFIACHYARHFVMNRPYVLSLLVVI